MRVSTEFLARVQQEEEIFANKPGSFAHETCVSRLPDVLRDCVASNRDQFSVEQSKRILELADDLISNAKIPLPSQYPDQASKTPASAHWEKLLIGKDYTWQDSPWFMVEQYIFHLLLLMTDYYSTGIDPFRPLKMTELKHESPWLLLQTAVRLASQKESSAQTHHDQLKRFMRLCLWGNKADGSNQKVKDTMTVTDTSVVFDDELLLVDHSDEIISYLETKVAEATSPKSLRVEFICDNVGTELLLDLAMTDYLLTHDWCGMVTFNVKAEPLYVSDVMIPDVHEHIAEMQRPTRTAEVQNLGKRLSEFIRTQQLAIRADDYWNTYTYFWEMPTELETRLANEATLVILKGDLNYRRLLGDRMWPPSTPIQEIMPYFPTAFVAFRILKSGLVVGIPEETVTRLDRDDPNWRYNGKRGTIQGVLRAAPLL
ncbi:hypothetical protein PHYBOEH_001593 [Phytophthora boehmeriae]|uniref:Sugar phosphate phosphatase n=1 Tax=Phytophthora boehmeriae TaxID=109152 RepID=A0A8T1WYT4_9STRA|nr:hypothetical protein PHYBOEH_001593 [Phytophthora boehmeriae]